tara:strand:+ start:263 stop:463 length:201 start_codon:yes stop_codon:yes gene_type:complete
VGVPKMDLNNYFRLKRRNDDLKLIKSVNKINKHVDEYSNDNNQNESKKSFNDMFQEMIDDESESID